MARPRKLSVLWTDTAFEDLDEIIGYLAQGGIAPATGALDRIQGQVAGLSSLPLRGRLVPELAPYSVRSYRELIAAPWRIIYRVERSRIWVVAVLDGRRSLEDLLLDRFLRSRP